MNHVMICFRCFQTGEVVMYEDTFIRLCVVNLLH